MQDALPVAILPISRLGDWLRTCWLAYPEVLNTGLAYMLSASCKLRKLYIVTSVKTFNCILTASSKQNSAELQTVRNVHAVHTNSTCTFVTCDCGGEKLVESSKQSVYINGSSMTGPFTRSLYVSMCWPRLSYTCKYPTAKQSTPTTPCRQATCHNQ